MLKKITSLFNQGHFTNTLQYLAHRRRLLVFDEKYIKVLLELRTDRLFFFFNLGSLVTHPYCVNFLSISYNTFLGCCNRICWSLVLIYSNARPSKCKKETW